MNKQEVSRRNFLRLGASAGMLAGLGHLNFSEAAQSATDYKALVCVFLFGGSDGHNTVIPQSQSEYAAYVSKRGGLALSGTQLLPITTATGGQYALNHGLTEMQTLFQQGRMAVVANTGLLYQPTTQQQYQQAAVPLPTQLFSHSDQIVQMQSGVPSSSSSSGWGGRIADALQTNNVNSIAPVAISFSGAALYCAGLQTNATALQPGNTLYQNAMNGGWPLAATTARADAQKQIVALPNSNRLIAASDRTFNEALQLNTMFRNLGNQTPFTTVFPTSSIGKQLKDVAQFISLRAQTGAGRQVFFVGLGGFDTHSAQEYQLWDLYRQVSVALKAFYDTTVELGVSNNVTSFTLSDFGRSLQPSGSGSDHGWGNHLMVVGGSVNGGRIHGQFPVMNANDSAYNPNAYADSRGVMLPTTALAQFGGTLANWMGVADNQLNGLFPELANFNVRNLGFMQ
jgi:uncharacterized protein (DUF1501 family)